MSDKLTVKFKCDDCGMVEGTAFVTPRTEGQDIEDWLTNVAVPETKAVHQMVSPGCGDDIEASFLVSKLGAGFLPTGEEDGTERV